MKSILIVEDSSMTRSMIRAITEDMEEEFETIEASTGFEALRLIPSRKFDLIITDINMPDINGLEFINFVKKDDRYRSIPVLVVSTERSGEDKKRGMALGADAYIAKPFQPQELHDAIKKLLIK
jgi:two-component system chemotaxis response regulator CheY